MTSGRDDNAQREGAANQAAGGGGDRRTLWQFWTTVPGFLGAVAAIIAACATVYSIWPKPGFRVVTVALTAADRTVSSEGCPATMTLRGVISAIGGAGPVSYRFVKSNGQESPVESVQFDAPGSRSIEFAWPSGPGNWSVQLEVLEPTRLTSEPVSLSVSCLARPGPNIPLPAPLPDPARAVP